MNFTDQRAIDETKTFAELNEGEFFQVKDLFYIKVDAHSAFNIVDCQLEEFSVNQIIQLREAEVVFH